MSNGESVMGCDARLWAAMYRDVCNVSLNVGYVHLLCIMLDRFVSVWRCMAMFDASGASHFACNYTGKGLNGHKEPIKKLLRIAYHLQKQPVETVIVG
jgi:hypothetical protein